MRTKGSSCRRWASSSLRRVSAFSSSSSSSGAASLCSRVPILWLFIESSFLWLQQVAVAGATNDLGHRRRESGNQRGCDEDHDSKSDDRQRHRQIDGGFRG